jgi:hypothetical protein
VRHARDEDLDQLESLLAQLRQFTELREKKRGSFYRGQQGFLHFHADPAGMFADVKLSDQFERVRVTTKEEQRRLITSVKKALR